MGGRRGQRDAGFGGAAVQLPREQEVRQLAVAIGLLGVVRRLRVALEHGIVTSVMCDRGHGDHPRVRRCEESGQEQAREREVAEVVGAELQLVTVVRLAVLRRRHHAGVVDQQVEGAFEAGHEVLDRLLGCEIELLHLGCAGHLARGLVARLGVSAGQDHLGAVVAEGACGVQADARVGAGDHCAGAGQVGEVVGGEAAGTGCSCCSLWCCSACWCGCLVSLSARFARCSTTCGSGRSRATRSRDYLHRARSR